MGMPGRDSFHAAGRRLFVHHYLSPPGTCVEHDGSGQEADAVSGGADIEDSALHSSRQASDCRKSGRETDLYADTCAAWWTHTARRLGQDGKLVKIEHPGQTGRRHGRARADRVA